MVYICIDDGTEEKIYMDTSDEILELSPWLVLNVNEIGTSIAHFLFHQETEITEEMIREEIDAFLIEIYKAIFDSCYDKLVNNNKTVK